MTKTGVKTMKDNDIFKLATHEVKRFRADHRHVVETEFDDAQFVGVADFGQVTAERDAALGREAALLENISRARPPHFCGLPMSPNPHPEAGAPGRYLEVGAVSECIPCVVASRHAWAEKAAALQQRLTVADERADVLETALRKIKARLDAYAEADMRMPEPSVEVCQMIADSALKPAEVPQ